MRCPLVFACDVGYAAHLATTLRSIVESNRAHWPLECHVLADGFCEQTRRRVAESIPAGSATISWARVDVELFRVYATMDHISPVTYARLLIPTVFGSDVSRVLYLDADILVLKDLKPLFEAHLDGAVVGAVLDGMDSRLKANKPGLERVPRVYAYFNAGVLLIDLDRWRKEAISEKAMGYLSAHPDSPFSDQDALNVVCDGRWMRLDEQWNFQDHDAIALSAADPDSQPSIIHFVTRDKPWKASSLSVNASFYDSFRRRTLFARSWREVARYWMAVGWHRSSGALRARASRLSK